MDVEFRLQDDNNFLGNEFNLGKCIFVDLKGLEPIQTVLRVSINNNYFAHFGRSKQKHDRSLQHAINSFSG